MNYSPRSVRNSFVSLEVDGRRSRIETGPKAKDGGLRTQFYVRDKGSVTRSVSIETSARRDGMLVLTVCDQHGNVIYAHETER